MADLEFSSLVNCIKGITVGKEKPIHVIEREGSDDLLIKELKDKPGTVSFLWIRGTVENQLFTFWKIKYSGILAEKTCVVFTDANNTPRWVDLHEYPYVKLGPVVLVDYDGRIRPAAVPSMKGQFSRR